MRSGGRAWCVIQRSAVTPLPETEVGLEALTLDPNAVYCAYEFWTGEVWIVNGQIHLKALSLGDTQVIALTRLDGDAPILIGSDRHVSCDAVSVAEVETRERRTALRLSGFAGLEVKYAFYAPEAAEILQAVGIEAQIERDGEVLRVVVRFSDSEGKLVLGRP